MHLRGSDVEKKKLLPVKHMEKRKFLPVEHALSRPLLPVLLPTLLLTWSTQMTELAKSTAAAAFAVEEGTGLAIRLSMASRA